MEKLPFYCLSGLLRTRRLLKTVQVHVQPCIVINVSVQHNGGLLPGIILLIQCYYHRGTRLNAMKRFCISAYDP